VLHNKSGFDWVVGVDWSPIKRTSVSLQTGRQSVESYNDASFIDVSTSASAGSRSGFRG